MIEYKIFPSIGIARLGNAPEKFYIGPEKYRGLPTLPDGQEVTEADLRDEQGRLSRQAARFQVYKVHNGIETPLSLGDAGIKSITWRVHMANKKASWYEFQTSIGENGYASNHPLRNAHVKGDARHTLVIDPGPRVIDWAHTGVVRFDQASVPADYQGAHFPPENLQPGNQTIDCLGELRTDGHGGLLVLGGLGKSGSTHPDPNANSYANNDDWWDDTSDGTVQACIEFDDGSVCHATSATVLATLPAFAPQIPSLVTLYDTMFDAVVRHGSHPDMYDNGLWKTGKDGYWPDFSTEIQPLLERGMLYPWVVAIPSKPHRFDFAMLGATETVDGVTQGSLAYKGMRQYVLDFLRPPGAEDVIIKSADNLSGTSRRSGVGATMMPFLAGDNTLYPGHGYSHYLRLTDTQYFFLQQWADGWFKVSSKDETARTIQRQPGTALTRAVLDNCVGGSFQPGMEMNWISRNPAIYAAPLRVRSHFVATGPLSLNFDPQRGMEPGDLTRYMAVPWQADFNECSSEHIDGRVLWWWPSQRPVNVYLQPLPDRAMNLPEPPGQQLAGRQVAWVGTDFDQKASNYVMYSDNMDMVNNWSHLGFVMDKQIDGEHQFVEVARIPPRWWKKQ